VGVRPRAGVTAGPAALDTVPDVDERATPALDAVDRLLLDTSAAARSGRTAHDVVVVGDPGAALAIAAARAAGASDGARLRAHQDSLVHERELTTAGAEVHALPLAPALVSGARVVLLRLPRSLDALGDVADLVAAHADPSVVLVAAGRIKHMALAMNDVLRARFDRLDVTHARQKSRALVARGPRAIADAGALPRVRRERHDLPGIGPVVVCAVGGVFAGTEVDIGTRFLLEHLAETPPPDGDVIDLACGSGVVATWLALRHPTLRVAASDVSAAAVMSTAATAAANGVADRVEVRQDDALASRAAGSASLIVLNPPFHDGAAIDETIARRLFADAARVLRPGGRLWTVWNSHLRHRPTLEATVGPTRQIARNAKFTVAVSTRR